MYFSQEGQTPLLLATRKRNIDMVMELVEGEVDLNHMEEVSVTFYYCICTSAITIFGAAGRIGVAWRTVVAGRTVCSDVVL